MKRIKKDIIKDYDHDSNVRLNKFLSDCGVCSRREADRLIEAGKVFVDGRHGQLGDKIDPDTNVVTCNGKVVKTEEEFILLAFNKPVGIECTANKEIEGNIIDFIKYPKRVYPIGRLDKDSEGLILLTNNGALVNNILKASNYHEKEYIVQVNKKITDDFIKHMSEGVPILDTVTRKCQVKKINEDTFNIVLTQGLNRQIRRMSAYLGYKVISLKRIRIMNIKIGKLKTGTYRNVSLDELNELLEHFQE